MENQRHTGARHARAPAHTTANLKINKLALPRARFFALCRSRTLHSPMSAETRERTNTRAHIRSPLTRLDPIYKSQCAVPPPAPLGPSTAATTLANCIQQITCRSIWLLCIEIVARVSEAKAKSSGCRSEINEISMRIRATGVLSRAPSFRLRRRRAKVEQTGDGSGGLALGVSLSKPRSENPSALHRSAQ